MHKYFWRIHSRDQSWDAAARSLACTSCHTIASVAEPDRIADTRQPPVARGYPYHNSCFGCHQREIYRGNRPAICTVCHTRVSPRATAADVYSAFPKQVELTLRQFPGYFPHRAHDKVIIKQTGQLQPAFPLHRDCTGCHLVQFTQAGGSVNPICTICHDTAQLHSGNAPLNRFSRLRSFTAEFDHAQHLQGIDSARPRRGCASCHVAARRGVAQTIPAQLDAHRLCYECHAAGKSASNSSSCGSCHGIGRYSPSSTAARAYRVSFSHAEHAGRQRLNCQSCHSVRGRGLPQGGQVASIMAVEHLVNTRSQTCKSCHNSQRAFGDQDTHDCRRCHRREGFRMTE